MSLEFKKKVIIRFLLKFYDSNTIFAQYLRNISYNNRA